LHDLGEPPHRQAGQYSPHGPILLRKFRDSDSYFPFPQSKFSVSPAFYRRNFGDRRAGAQTICLGRRPVHAPETQIVRLAAGLKKDGGPAAT
jgi:hypothetical protein